MINTSNTPTLFFLAICILLVLSVVLAVWGRKLPWNGSWLVWSGFLILLAGIGLDSGLFFQTEFETRIWSSGWIWSKTENGAITVGMLQDPLGLAMATLVVLVTGLLLIGYSSFSRQEIFERVVAGLGISTTGVALAWNSLTPWVAFLGTVLAMIGGILGIPSKWGSETDSKLSAKFAMERSIGFLLAFLGTCILSTSRPALLLNSTELWASGSNADGSTVIGATLLVLGLFVQLQPFPFLGLLVSRSEGFLPLRILAGQILPALTCFPLLVRLEPQLRSLGVFPHFGWVAFVSSILTGLSGLFQKDWDSMIGLWVSAGLSLCLVLLAFSGPFASMALLISLCLATIAMVSIGFVLEKPQTEGSAQESREVWVKVAVFLGAAAGTGAIGFLSATGCIHWIAQSLNLPAMTAAFLVSVSVYVLLGWRLARKMSFQKVSTRVPWVVIFSTFVCLIFSLACIWTGTATGNLLKGSPDRFAKSIFDGFFGNSYGVILESDNFISASGLFWGVFIFSVLVAYWSTGRKLDRFSRVASYFPRASQFIMGGYGIEFLGVRVMEALEWTGRWAEKIVDSQIWSIWMPRSLVFGVQGGAELTHELDLKLSHFLGAVVKKLVDLPAKLLQLVQTGDLRWYLFFVLGSGFVLLAHYFKM